MEHERVVDLLRRSADAMAPTSRERELMRRRVLAAFDASLDSDEDSDEPVAHLSGRSTVPERLMVALAAALCLVLCLGAMSLLLSRDALPGDPLYGIKRSAESASFGLAFDDGFKARKHLEFATARIDELRGMVERGGTPAGSYLTALGDFDTDAAAGSRLLTVLGTNGDGSQLTYLRDWARSQANRLAALRPSLPDRAAASATLLTAIIDRAGALIPRLNCYAVTTGATDDIGALPVSGGCATRPPTVSGSSAVTSSPVPKGQFSQPSGGGGRVGGVTTTTAPPISLTAPAVPPPVTSAPSRGGKPTRITIALPLPLGALPPLLPGLPGIVVGG